MFESGFGQLILCAYIGWVVVTGQCGMYESLFSILQSVTPYSTIIQSKHVIDDVDSPEVDSRLNTL